MLRYLLIAATLAIPVALGQDAPLNEHSTALNFTCGFLNGRSWNSVSDGFQVGYVVGVMEADTEGRFNTIRMTRGEITNAITDFFKDPLNFNVPIIGALIVVVNKARGASPDAETSYQRKVWSTCLQKPQRPTKPQPRFPR